MLTQKGEWVEVVEVNPPLLPSMNHLLLGGRWDNVLVTDNPFKQVRVSPYAFAARITHDAPEVHPTVVVSTRDRNILAIESEVRGALGNGVESFLVVVGDTLPEVDHWANHYEIVEHLRALQSVMPAFEVGMTTRFQEWMFRRRCEVGAQFFVAGPVLDPHVVRRCAERLNRRQHDPPVYLGVVPPFSAQWARRLRGLGAVPITEELRARLNAAPPAERRRLGWQSAKEVARRAQDEGFSGIVLMGLKFETLIGEAQETWFS
ncbi:MAG: methylenetetrahydrofolate reductase [Actinomycetota bacterium]|nr:methylenetetrahydrofolate reductase [Actinomycetota bacterium]